jgi:pimeloyl-ACP methyl ester carboxylesterase
VGEHIDIRGHPTWVEDRGGADEAVLVLHGGMSNSDFLLDSFGDALGGAYRVVAFDRRGHGYTADTAAPFHYEDMADETIAVLEHVVGGRAHLVGWSDGGIVALAVAIRRPDLVARMVLIGTNFHYEGVLQPHLPEDAPFRIQVREDYATRAPEGPEYFRAMVDKSLTMWTTEPTWTEEDLVSITAPTLVLAADDELIPLSHTAALYEALPAGQLCVVPRTSHALPIERRAEVARVILDFLAADIPPATLLPVRRAPGGD